MWSSNNRVPIQSTPENANRPIARHHTARYYVHRVKESLTTRVSKLICAIFLALLFFVGMISFILWLSLRPHRPRFHIEDFSIPIGSEINPVIVYNATAHNANQNMGIYYDNMQLQIFYHEQSMGGSPVLSSFYQVPKNTTIIAGQLNGSTLTVSGPQWQQIIGDRARGLVVFRVEISATIRFKISTWDSKRHRLHANCPVGVGPDGLALRSYTVKRCPVYFS